MNKEKILSHLREMLDEHKLNNGRNKIWDNYGDIDSYEMSYIFDVLIDKIELGEFD